MGVIKLNLLGDRVKELLASENYLRPIETMITVDPNALLELRNPLCNLPLLREIADASGGLIVPPTGLEACFGASSISSPKRPRASVEKPCGIVGTCSSYSSRA
jgi:hypothetical protein